MSGHRKLPRRASRCTSLRASALRASTIGSIGGTTAPRCPRGEDRTPCRIGFHGSRARKTGPCIPLTVAHCHTHGVSFTIYPPAHVPYGRAAVTPVDLEGRRVRGVEDGGELLGLTGTVWEPIADADQGRRWPDVGGYGSRRTQGRRLEFGASLFGLLSEARVRERIAVALRVPALALHETAASYPERGRWRERAGALLSLLRLSLRGRADVLLAAQRSYALDQVNGRISARIDPTLGARTMDSVDLSKGSAPGVLWIA